MPLAPSIEIDLARKLVDREFRREFLSAEASAKIAEQIIALRKRRNLNQSEVAALIGTGQPAISRAERADYDSWSYKALKAIADALDGRLRVIIEAWEDVAHEYEEEGQEGDVAHRDDAASALRRNTINVPSPADTFSVKSDVDQYATRQV